MTVTNEVWNVGIIGAGNISAVYLKLAPLFANFRIVAVADIYIAAAERRAGEFGIVGMGVDELLADPDIRVVVNLTIPSAHFEVSRRILEAGKHVYSEKPFVLDLEDGLKLKALADARGLRVASAPDTFLGASHQQVRAIIDNGDVGTITSGTMHMMGPGMEHWHPNPHFFFQPGAGPVLDVGPYYVTALINLLGPVARVSAITGSARTERLITSPGSPLAGTSVPVNTPTTIHSVMEFESGAIVTFGASWDVHAHGHHNIELYGSDGTIFVPDPNFFGGDVVVADRNGVRRTLPATSSPFARANVDLDKAVPRANYRTAGLADLIASLQEGRPARCSLELCLHAVDVMLSILRSGETGRSENLSTTCSRPAPLTPDMASLLLRSEGIPIETD